MHTKLLAITTGFVLALIISNATSAQSFEGRVVTEWSTEPSGREMILIEDFVFVDASEVRWVAPSGSVVDGASIPQVFWSFFGSPFVGRYRRASILHDVYCNIKTAPHREVHRMFFDAIRADGVNLAVARLMYAAVAVFGPKWVIIESSGLEGAERRVVDIHAEPEITFDELVRRIEEQDLSVDDIEQLAKELEP